MPEMLGFHHEAPNDERWLGSHHTSGPYRWARWFAISTGPPRDLEIYTFVSARLKCDNYRTNQHLIYPYGSPGSPPHFQPIPTSVELLLFTSQLGDGLGAATAITLFGQFHSCRVPNIREKVPGAWTPTSLFSRSPLTTSIRMVDVTHYLAHVQTFVRVRATASDTSRRACNQRQTATLLTLKH